MDDKNQLRPGQEAEAAAAGDEANSPRATGTTAWSREPEALPSEWRQEISRLANEGGTVLLLGGSDVGKSSFCRALIHKAISVGPKTAVVDADVGQSSFGLPGTVTLVTYGSTASAPPAPGSAIPSYPPQGRTFFFVGAVSPRDCLMNHLVATVRAAQAAWEAGAELTVVDTTGYVSAPEGALLKRAKIDAIRPDVVVALPHKNELQSILGAYSGLTFPRVAILPPSPQASSRKRETRRKTRQDRFREYFCHAKRFRLSLSQRVLLADFPLEWQRHRPSLAQLCAKNLGYPVAFATFCGDIPLVVTEVECTPTEVESLIVSLKTKPRTYPCEQFQNCLVGLTDAADDPIGVGLLAKIDWQNGCAEVLVPEGIDLARTHTLKLGRIRIDADGTELAPANW